MAIFTWAIFGVSAIALLLFVRFAWWGRKVVSLATFKMCRVWLAIFVTCYAGLTVTRLIYEVAVPRCIPADFVSELVSYLVFWVLAPPTWFFAEYLALEGGRIKVANKIAVLATAKIYADYASKIWAGVLGLMIALLALGK